MSKLSAIATTVGLGALALSFPAALFFLNAPALDELERLAKGSAPAALPAGSVSLERVVESKVEEVKQVDARILEARGELLKFEQIRERQIEELKDLRDRVARFVQTLGAPDGDPATQPAGQ